MNRRRLLVASGGALVAPFAGCLSDSDGVPDTDGSDEQTDAEKNSAETTSQAADDCVGPLPPKSGYGRADPFVETSNVGEIKDAERVCEQIARDTIFTTVEEETDLDAISNEENWLSSSVNAERITLIIRSETNQSGTLVRCPPTAYQYEDVAASVPSEITITLQSDDDSFVWSREVVIEHRHSYLD